MKYFYSKRIHWSHGPNIPQVHLDLPNIMHVGNQIARGIKELGCVEMDA
jgi:hypothetical protein